MVEIGSTVSYGSEGIYSVREIIEKELGDKRQSYYVLESVRQTTTCVFVPVNSEKLVGKIRKVANSKEADKIISDLPYAVLPWLDNDSDRMSSFREILAQGDCKDMLQLARTLYLHREELEEQGKKTHACDVRMQRLVEDRVSDELALALNIEPSAVMPYISQHSKVKRRR
jgi:CarD family transcriptional regulator